MWFHAVKPGIQRVVTSVVVEGEKKMVRHLWAINDRLDSRTTRCVAEKPLLLQEDSLTSRSRGYPAR